MTRSQLEILIDAVEAESPSRASWIHGSQHWKCVAQTGIRFARQTEGASPLIALLFGLFHDSMREEDEAHGERGAQFAQEFAQRGLLLLPADSLTTLLHACRKHTGAKPTDDPIIGVCYDADRLHLWRVGVRPKKRFLSTEAGKVSCDQEDTRYLHDAEQSWCEILNELFEEPSSKVGNGRDGHVLAPQEQ